MKRFCDATIDGMAICGALLSEAFVLGVLVPLVLLYAGVRWMLRIPLAIALVALSVGSVASADDSWRAGPGYPLPVPPGYTVERLEHTQDWQQEFARTPGYWSREWMNHPECCGQCWVNMWHPPGCRLTGRMTLQPKTWVHYTFRDGRRTVRGKADYRYFYGLPLYSDRHCQ